MKKTSPSNCRHAAWQCSIARVIDAVASLLAARNGSESLPSPPRSRLDGHVHDNRRCLYVTLAGTSRLLDRCPSSSGRNEAKPIGAVGGRLDLSGCNRGEPGNNPDPLRAASKLATGLVTLGASNEASA